MTESTTFYWYDFETFGLDCRRDRPAQFAGIRTDMDLNPQGDGDVFYSRPSGDYLPSPESCLLTGMTPQICEEGAFPRASLRAKSGVGSTGPERSASGTTRPASTTRSRASFSGAIFSIRIPISTGTDVHAGTCTRLSALSGRFGATASSGRSERMWIPKAMMKRASASGWSV